MLKKKEEQTTGKNIGKNMCKIEQKLQRKHLIALSFFLPLLVMTGCCIAFGVQPFGDNSLLIIDGLHQYMPFYSILYDFAVDDFLQSVLGNVRYSLPRRSKLKSIRCR